jgi:hypothetical protein
MAAVAAGSSGAFKGGGLPLPFCGFFFKNTVNQAQWGCPSFLRLFFNGFPESRVKGKRFGHAAPGKAPFWATAARFIPAAFTKSRHNYRLSVKNEIEESVNPNDAHARVKSVGAVAVITQIRITTKKLISMNQSIKRRPRLLVKYFKNLDMIASPLYNAFTRGLKAPCGYPLIALISWIIVAGKAVRTVRNFVRVANRPPFFSGLLEGFPTFPFFFLTFAFPPVFLCYYLCASLLIVFFNFLTFFLTIFIGIDRRQYESYQ